MCVYILLALVMAFTNRSMILRRKFVKYIVTMAGLMTSVVKSVAKLFENGIQLSRNDCRSLDIICTRLLGSLPVLMVDSMGQGLEVRTMMMMRMMRVRLHTLEHYTVNKFLTS